MKPKSSLAIRPRRLRTSPAVRDILKETRLNAKQLIAPFFVVHGNHERKPIQSMPGHCQLSVDQLLVEIGKAKRAGIAAVLLFGLPKKKDRLGKEAYDPKGIIQIAIRAVKKTYPSMLVMADLCFCEYTTHGHCGVIKKTGKGWYVDNDRTLELIRKAALAQAKAGVDFVAPSGMTDGAVHAIRSELDKHHFKGVGVMAYSAKYASAFYGPFRDAADSAPQFGDRRAYQLDPANVREAVWEIQNDVNEGADMVMVKPALAYLDVVSRIRPHINIPLVAYNVSGEYAMVKAAEQRHWLDHKKPSPAALEILTAMKRAGADLIITYHAVEIAQALK